MFVEIFIIALFAGISPGPDFFMVTTNSMGYGKKIGIASAMGIACALGVHATYSILGLTIIMQNYHLLFVIIQLFGAAYLAYIGIITIIATLRYKKSNIDIDINNAKPKSFMNGFANGFLCNILNPKAYIFFLSIFSQFMSPDTEHWVEWIYGLEVVIVIGLWFVLVALLISSTVFKSFYTKFQKWLERLFGAILILFAIKIGKAALTGD